MNLSENDDRERPALITIENTVDQIQGEIEVQCENSRCFSQATHSKKPHQLPIEIILIVPMSKIERMEGASRWKWLVLLLKERQGLIEICHFPVDDIALSKFHDPNVKTHKEESQERAICDHDVLQIGSAGSDGRTVPPIRIIVPPRKSESQRKERRNAKGGSAKQFSLG